jgi:hypothetical protein
VANGCLLVIRLADRDPDFARLIVNLSHAETLFAAAMGPYARVAVERGMQTGRFVVVDIEVTLTAVIGGAFALIRDILEGRQGGAAANAFAKHVLAALGLTAGEAAAVTEAAEASLPT